MTESPRDVVVVGAPRVADELIAAGITNVAVLPDPADVIGSVFDEATHIWTLRTRDERTVFARIVVSDRTPSGSDDLAPYLGVAVHGVPNHFSVTGPTTLADARLRYIVECLKLMQRTASTRIEVRHSTQRTFNDRNSREHSSALFWRRMWKRVPTAFDLSSLVAVEDEVYDGSATIRIGDAEHAVRVRLSGHLDPIDGRYHWRGTVFDGLPDDALKRSHPVTVAIGERTAEGRITERTPWGSYSVVGVGPPPYPLDDVEVAVPGR